MSGQPSKILFNAGSTETVTDSRSDDVPDDYVSDDDAQDDDVLADDSISS